MRLVLGLGLWLVAVAGAGEPAPPPAKVAREVADALLKGDYAAVAARFDDTMKRVLSVEKLRQTCEPIGLMSGKLVRVEAARTSVVQGYDVVVIPVVFENASWD